MNLAYLLQRSAANCPDKAAIVQGDSTLTYRELWSHVSALADYLTGRGLLPGDRVAVMQHNSPGVLVSMFAAFCGGFAVVPINVRSTPAEMNKIVADAEPKAVLYGREFSEHIALCDSLSTAVTICTNGEVDEAETLPSAIGQGTPRGVLYDDAADSNAWLFYTSGTTGQVKGACLSHRNLLTMITAYLGDIQSLAPASTMLHAAPLSHGSGLYALPAVARGVTQILTASRSFEPEELFGLIQRYAVTDIAFLAPTMIKRMVERRPTDSHDVSSLQNIVYGGAPMYLDDVLAALDTFGPVFTQIYGQAEAPVTISRLTVADHERACLEAPSLLTSAGRLFTSTEARIAGADGASGEGEIAARGDVVMSGYWRNDHATADALRDGWLYTGDIGRFDDQGYLFLLDRNKDVIISGAANIYPREIEDVILEHPLVRQAAVVGAPDAEWGERVVAVLELETGASRDDVQQSVEKLCRERLSGYKRPREYAWVDKLPVNSYGKIVKREIRDAYWSGQGRKI